MKMLPTLLLQIFCKIILNFQVVVKNIKDPDDNFMNNSQPLYCCWLILPIQNDAKNLKND